MIKKMEKDDKVLETQLRDHLGTKRDFKRNIYQSYKEAQILHSMGISKEQIRQYEEQLQKDQQDIISGKKLFGIMDNLQIAKMKLKKKIMPKYDEGMQERGLIDHLKENISERQKQGVKLVANGQLVDPADRSPSGPF